jgi:hypothetical protein
LLHIGGLRRSGDEVDGARHGLFVMTHAHPHILDVRHDL